MSYYLALLPDERANYQIRKALATAGELFDSHGVPITLVKPESFHITLLFFGNSMSAMKKDKLGRVIKKYPVDPFDVSVGNMRLGINRNYRELLFLTVDQGAEQMRDMVHDLASLLKMKRERVFIPHISLGRVTKDLSDEEFRNLGESIHQVNQELMKSLGDTSFKVERVYLMKSEDGENTVVKEFAFTNS
jgi:2'-5' RNA ligase